MPLVHESRRWELPESRESDVSPDTVTVSVGFVGTLEFDFSERLNPGEGVSTVDSVVATGLTFGTLTVRNDRRTAQFDLTAGQAADTTYVVTVTVTTTDGDTLIGVGNLHCE